ncbi:O-antigen ligase family protein [Rhodococcus opacus]|uniref:O-antigen ligase family protein n=1 Tax=Rhodococcus opacus TaxID=37919 RepID=UPI0022359F9B|nr:O-antigen ligase family protein [Rhodococcus opacus]UZG57431.1 O-antigen ligase family protein [Rhodococcus opacus]
MADLVWMIATVCIPLAVVVGTIKYDLGGKLFAGAAALGLAIGALSRPRLALYGVIVIACVTRDLDILGLQIDLASAGLLIFAPALKKTWTLGQIPKVLRYAAGFIVLGHFLSAFDTMSIDSALWGAARWLLILNWAAALYVHLANGGQKGLRRVATVVALVGGVVAAIGWMQMRGMYLPFIGPPYADRPDSTFGYYSNYANFVALAAVISFGITLEWLRQRRPAIALVTFGCFAVTAYEVVAAASRGAVILALTALGALVVLTIRRPGRTVTYSISIAAGAVLLYSVIPAEVLSELLDRFDSTQGGDRVRYALEGAGQLMLQQHPLGIGFESFAIYTRMGLPGATVALAHAHDLYVQVGLDGGWLGLAGFVLLASVALWRGTVAGLVSGGGATQGLFAAVLLGSLVQGVNDYFFFETGSLLFFALVIVGASVSRTEPPTASDEAVGEPSQLRGQRRVHADSLGITRP